MKNTRNLFCLLLALVMVMSMAACGGGTTTQQTEAQAPAATQAQEPAAQQTEAPAAKIYEGVKLEYWSNWEATETQGQIITEAVAEFEEETGCEVDLEFKGRSGIKQGLIPALDADQQVDLFDGAGNKSNFGDRIISVESLMAERDYEKDSNAAMMALCRGYYADGETREIPYQMKGNGYLYNKALFREAGIESVPTNWEEFLDCCQKLQDAGITPLTTDDAYTPQAFGYHLARMIGSDAVKNVVDNGLWAETPEVLATAQAFEDLASKGYFPPLVASNVFPNGQNTEFATGQIGMYCVGTWLPNEVRNITGDDFEWGFFNYPEVEGGINGTEAMVIGSQSFAITNKCQNTEIFAVTGGLENNPDITPAVKENLAKLYAGQITAQEFVNNMEAAAG